MPKPSPMLAPNELVAFDEISYPVYASPKMDGMRVMMVNREMQSRNWKPLGTAAHINWRTALALAHDKKLVIDGELYAHGGQFNTLMSTLKPSAKSFPPELIYHVFDAVPYSDWGQNWSLPFCERNELAAKFCHEMEKKGIANVKHVFHSLIETPHHLEEFFNNALSDGYEGLIVRSVTSRYKHGRGTLNEGLIYKFKTDLTMDCQIIGFEQGTRMKDEVRSGERETDEMGYLKRSHKKDTRELVDRVGAVKVRSREGLIFEATFAKSAYDLRVAMTWAKRNMYMGKWVEVTYMPYGVKEKPRFPRITRLRPDLE